jgi:hypothetical protein
MGGCTFRFAAFGEFGPVYGQAKKILIKAGFPEFRPSGTHPSSPIQIDRASKKQRAWPELAVLANSEDVYILWVMNNPRPTPQVSIIIRFNRKELRFSGAATSPRQEQPG